MTLNARRRPRIAYKRQKPMIIKPNYEKISKTSKLQPVNLSETSRDTNCVHQGAADSL